MTNQDDLFQAAIIDELVAQMGYRSISMKDLSTRLKRPYDSTRNYLIKERAMPFSFFLEATAAIGMRADELIALARRRL